MGVHALRSTSRLLRRGDMRGTGAVGINITSSLHALPWSLCGTVSALWSLLVPDRSVCSFGNRTSIKWFALSMSVSCFALVPWSLQVTSSHQPLWLDRCNLSLSLSLSLSLPPGMLQGLWVSLRAYPCLEKCTYLQHLLWAHAMRVSTAGDTRFVSTAFLGCIDAIFFFLLSMEPVNCALHNVG
jgi:hypothetical protein